MPRRGRAWVAALVATIAVGIGVAAVELSARGTTSPARLPRDANIVIAVLDACRADKLGSFGFGRDTSPNLDAVARDPDATRFRRHYVQAPATKASTASLFTGVYPFQHGLRTNFRGGAGTESPAPARVHGLADHFDTLAERLRTRGYHTFAVVKSNHLLPEYGFAQGFDRYVTPSQALSDPARVQRFVELVREARAPFFGYVHVNACHHPFPERERDPGYMRQYGIAYDEAARRAAGVDFTTSEVMWKIRSGALRLEPADIEFLNLVYEAGVRATDAQLVAPLLDGLRQAGVYDRTLLLITADHGEELYEHAGYAHGHGVWEELIHVPLIAKFPRGARPAGLGAEVTVPTRAIDVLPSLVALIDGAPPSDVPGRAIFGGGVAAADVYAETAGVDGEQPVQALQHGNEKLIRTPARTWLFDLAQDPGERNDLAPARGERVTALTEAMKSLQTTAAPFQAPTVELNIPPAAREQMRALGYAVGDE